MRADGGTRLKRGDSVSLDVSAEHVHAFDAQERAPGPFGRPAQLDSPARLWKLRR